MTQNPEQEGSSGNISDFKWVVRDLNPDRDTDMDLLFPGISSATPCSFQDIILILSQWHSLRSFPNGSSRIVETSLRYYTICSYTVAREPHAELPVKNSSLLFL